MVDVSIEDICIDTWWMHQYVFNVSIHAGCIDTWSMQWLMYQYMVDVMN